jgi:hypothetical protein
VDALFGDQCGSACSELPAILAGDPRTLLPEIDQETFKIDQTMIDEAGS